MLSQARPEKPGKIWKSAGTSNDKNFEDSSHLSGLFRRHSCIILYSNLEWNKLSFISLHRHHGQFFSHSVEVPSSEVLPWATRWTFVDPWQVGVLGFTGRKWKEHQMDDDDDVIYMLYDLISNFVPTCKLYNIIYQKTTQDSKVNLAWKFTFY